MSTAPTKIARGFKRTDPAIVKGHPLRGSLRYKLQQRDQQIAADVEPRRSRGAMARDMLISLVGAASAMVPLVVAFQSVMGA